LKAKTAPRMLEKGGGTILTVLLIIKPWVWCKLVPSHSPPCGCFERLWIALGPDGGQQSCGKKAVEYLCFMSFLFIVYYSRVCGLGPGQRSMVAERVVEMALTCTSAIMASNIMCMHAPGCGIYVAPCHHRLQQISNKRR
jgi:hypothetical protein